MVLSYLVALIMFLDMFGRVVRRVEALEARGEKKENKTDCEGQMKRVGSQT